MTDYKTESLLIDQEGYEVEVDVYFDYQPYEPQELNYPGCEAEITINTVEHNGEVDLDSLDKKQMDSLIQDCWDFMKIELDTDKYE